MISVSNLSRKFDTLWAVKDLSFQIRDGEVFALLGPNGAGKTTTVKMMVGMISTTEGDIKINDYDIRTNPQEIKSELGYVPESCALYENLTGREHLELVCRLHHLPEGNISDQVERLIDLLGLKEATDQRITSYSKGMKQKILLAGAIIHNPRLLILDEPFSGLDANTQSVFKKLIREFVRGDRIVIFCSHILEVVENMCDRLLIIDKGKKLIEGTPLKIVAATGKDSLSEAFNQLTGATDIDDQARGILDALERDNKSDNKS